MKLVSIPNSFDLNSDRSIWLTQPFNRPLSKMKLFSLPDGEISAKDRAQWMTPPFDRQLDTERISVNTRSSIGTRVGVRQQF